MSDQLTQCPHCQTSFRVTPGQLKAAGGLVRCGSCLGLFSAAINFIRVKPDPDDSQDMPLEPDDMASSDDILLGDLDLDSLPLMEHAEDDDYDEALAEDDEVEDAKAILLSDPVQMRRAQPEEYVLYEEYEEAPDLLANLATAPEASAAALDASELQPFVLTPDTDPEVEVEVEVERTIPFDDDAELDWLDGPSEEFKPRTILFDDDDEDDADEADEEPDAEDDDFVDAAADESDLVDDYPDAVLAGGREASLERGGPVLGELDADEFETPELSELELDELLLTSDTLEYDHFEDAEDSGDADAADSPIAPGAHFEHGLTESRSDADNSAPDDEDAEAILEEYMEEIRVDARDRGEAMDDLFALTGHNPARGATGKGKPDWLQRHDSPPAEKAAMHDYLATLEDEDELEPLGTDHLDELDDEPVLLAADGRKRSLLATTGLLLLSLLLMGTLLLQFVDQHLDALRQRNSFARFEPWFCAVLDCPPAPVPVTASSSLYSQELLIRSHPRLKGALELSFIFRNDGAEPQPFPGLELSFKDPANTLLANRLLLPDDYLPPELRSLQAMPANSSVQIMLELVDPGAEAVNYTIAFRDL